MKTTIYALLTISLISFSSCQDDANSNGPKTRQDIPLSRTEETISDKTQEFSLNLIKEVLQSEGVKGQNLFFSPLGVSAVLNMLGNGASGKTATEIYSALSPEGCTAEDLNGFYSKLNTWLPDLDNTTTVAMAYSLWVRNTFNVKSSYTDLLKSTLNSDVFVKDFSNPQSTHDLYDWCGEKTNGCIREIGLDLSKHDMTAVNALYFKGTWKEKFDESKTETGLFYGTTDSTNVEMMCNKTSLQYASSDDFMAVNLPYGNEAYSMLLVLPPEGCDMVQAGKLLMEGVLEDLTTHVKSAQVYVRLPRFEITYDFSAEEILTAMGIKEAFDGTNANFSKLSDNSLYLQELSQKTFVRVDESGTKAVAVTYVDGLTSNINGGIGVIFDHPFFFFIREKSTGLILFMGKVENL